MKQYYKFAISSSVDLQCIVIQDLFFSHPPEKSRKISHKRNESSKLTGPK